MKLQELITKHTQQLEKVQSLATKTATNTEKYYWEVRQLKENVIELVNTTKELTELVLSLAKQQIGD